MLLWFILYLEPYTKEGEGKHYGRSRKIPLFGIRWISYCVEMDVLFIH